MRTKNRGRRKRSSASTPSSTTSPFVPIPDAPNAECNEASTKETHDVSYEGDCFPKDTCIRCDESSGLLVCSETGCPIAVHEHCLSCKPTFDEEGNFYCPYCSYKRAMLRVNEMRRKAMAAKRMLSDFIDIGAVRGDNSLQMDEAGEKKASDVPYCGVDANTVNGRSLRGGGSLQDQAMRTVQNEIIDGNHETTKGNDQPSVVVDGENRGNPLLSNVLNNVLCQLREVTPEVQPPEDSMNEEVACEAHASETHLIGKTIEKDNIRSMDHIENVGIAKDRGELEASSAHHAEKGTAVNDVDHGSDQEQENLKLSKEIQGKADDGEQIQPGKEGELEDIIFGSGNTDMDNGTSAKKRDFKPKNRRRKDLRVTDAPRKSPRIREPGEDYMTNIEKISVSRILRQQQESANRFKNLNFHHGKRKRLHWSIEEEEMLKEGVRKFSSANKNIPWRRILEFGHHIFDETRTPIDLKDKWRNIVARGSPNNG